MEFIIRVFKTKNLALMFFLVLRYLILPLKKVSIYLPKKGTFIEVGCGHGIISYFLAKDEVKRNILAIDPDKRRIMHAKKMFNNVNNLKFEKRFFDKWADYIIDINTFDVEYYDSLVGNINLQLLDNHHYSMLFSHYSKN